MTIEKCPDCKKVGEVLDGLGVTLHWPEGELFMPVEAVVLVKGVDKDGRAAIRIGWPDGMDWISRRGMIEVARDQERTEPEWGDEDGD